MASGIDMTFDYETQAKVKALRDKKFKFWRARELGNKAEPLTQEEKEWLNNYNKEWRKRYDEFMKKKRGILGKI